MDFLHFRREVYFEYDRGSSAARKARGCKMVVLRKLHEQRFERASDPIEAHGPQEILCN